MSTYRGTHKSLCPSIHHERNCIYKLTLYFVLQLNQIRTRIISTVNRKHSRNMRIEFKRRSSSVDSQLQCISYTSSSVILLLLGRINRLSLLLYLFIALKTQSFVEISSNNFLNVIKSNTPKKSNYNLHAASEMADHHSTQL